VRPLAPSPAWTLVTPYCKRTRPGRGTNTKAAGFPPLSRLSPAASLPPFALGLALDPFGLGHAATFTRRLRDPAVSKRRQMGTHITCEISERLHVEIFEGAVPGFSRSNQGVVTARL
jgi:hypothetical protein